MEEGNVKGLYPTTVKTFASSEKGSDVVPSSPGHVYDKHAERKLLLKIDMALLPILLLLFLTSFVDRSNIGNAKIEGLEKSLKMKGNQYNIAVFVFNIPYVLLDIPSNLMLRKVRPGYWLGTMMFCWGVVTIGQGLAKNFAGFVACRTLMGVFEAGFVPGCALLIGSYYKRHEFQLRYSCFFSGAILAGAFSSFLAYLLTKMDGVGGYEGWRWIFIMEGIITCIIAAAATFLIAPWPQDCKFLTPTEKEMLLFRLEEDSSPGKTEHWSGGAIKAVLTDWKIWLSMIAYFGADYTAGALTAFQPTILSQLGYTKSQAQVHGIPIYLVAMVLSLTAAFLSDRFQHRYFFCMFGSVLAIIGWSIQLAQAGTPAVRYFALFLSCSGTYILMPVLVVWLSNNMGGSAKRSFATAFQIGLGNCAAFVSSNAFIAKEQPKFPTGFGAGMGLQVMSLCATSLMAILLYKENKKRDRGARVDRASLSREELNKLGDNHPDFRYTI